MYVAKGSKKLANIEINEHRIQQVSSLKFLGRTINNCMSITQHYQQALKDTESSINLLK